MKPIYLDYNATTPIDPEVAAVMKPYLGEVFGNPSSAHYYGQQAKKAVDTARQQVADLLDCQPGEIVFTSGGSESNNYAIKGIALNYQHKGNHIITSTIEHPAVSEVCKYLEGQGFRVTYLPVDNDGLISIKDLKTSLTPQTILITIMHANNEVGTIQPIEEIAEIGKKYGIPVHTDAAQSVGKIPTKVDELGVDLLSIAGHKLYAPKGIGVLYNRQGVELQKLIHGASHEQNHRAGTENVLEIVGLGKACEIAKRDMVKNMKHMAETRDRLEHGLKDCGVSSWINGHPQRRLPNTLSIGFKDVKANLLLEKIGERVAASAGSACHADSVKVSKVLEAMQVPLEYAMGTIRFSTGRMTTDTDVDQTVEVVRQAILSAKE